MKAPLGLTRMLAMRCLPPQVNLFTREKVQRRT